MKMYDHTKVKFTYNPSKEGFIEIRKGTPCLSLGNYRYVQGRILLDNGRYSRGLMTYSSNVPDGYDIQVNFMTWRTFWCSILDLSKDEPFMHPMDKGLSINDISQLDDGCIYKLVDKDEGWLKWSNDYSKNVSKIIGRKPRRLI